MAMISGTVSAGSLVSGQVRTAEAAKVELVFSNRSEFPDAGKPDRLYVATDENTAYRFDAEQNIYVRLNQFDAIQCRLADE